MQTVRLSVRALVEFTHHGEDIVPAGSLRDMREGMLGHKGRQAALPEGWQAEVPLSLTVPAGEDTELTVSGRMDAFLDGTEPAVEEIKLWQGSDPPERPETAHRMQAEAYAHILCVSRGLERVTVRVAYVDRQGTVRALFTDTPSAAELAAGFEVLLRNWLRRRQLLTGHAKRRDEALKALPFPYERWRPGQREMAGQCYTAIRRRRRLFASMPTGTGKSCAALFPALKALGEGLTEKVFYLTARTTQRQGPLNALERMQARPFPIWTLILDAKERICPESPMRCAPAFCPRAKGHYLRDSAVIEELMGRDTWTEAEILETADRNGLCPFELCLSLCEAADLVICDYNYALDPAVHLQRIFERGIPVTLLIDEAHNLQDRVRSMLSAAVEGGTVYTLRAELGRRLGRKTPLYRAMTRLLKALQDVPAEDGQAEGRLDRPPEDLLPSAEAVLDAWLDIQREGVWIEGMKELAGDLLGLQRAAADAETAHAVLWSGKSHPTLTLQALGVGPYFARVTAAARGTVCFSATLDPLEETRMLLGGGEEDACFSVPSPFPPENLLVLRVPVNTRYRNREASAPRIAALLAAMAQAHPGRYFAFFPSYTYMQQVAEVMIVPCMVQRRNMTVEERERFLIPFRARSANILALCVLGGVFAEGVDLPGDCLDGVAVIGTGLPQVGVFCESLREWHAAMGRDGFRYAYTLPGMQRVTQAVGRVIRSETDRGVALLLDDRYRRADVRALCPPHWQITEGDPEQALREFWRRMDDDPGDPV